MSLLFIVRLPNRAPSGARVFENFPDDEPVIMYFDQDCLAEESFIWPERLLDDESREILSGVVRRAIQRGVEICRSDFMEASA